MALVTLKELLGNIKDKGAVGAFSTYDLFTAQGIIAGAEKVNMPVILMIGSGPLSKPGNFEVGKLMVKLAQEAKVPAAVFLDHSKSFELCMKAIQLGFSSVMIDGSHLPFEENVALTKKVVEAAHAVGVSVEAELGALAGIEDGESVANAKVTDPKDAAKFVELTNVDAMALSIGNAHGLYKGVPNLHYDVLEETAKLIDTPLVLHGGTGIPADMIKKAITLGVSKINVNTECQLYFQEATRKYIEAGKDLEGKGYDPRKLLAPGAEAIKQCVKDRMEVFGCIGKA